VSLIGSAGADWELLSLGDALQAELGVPDPPAIGADRDVGASDGRATTRTGSRRVET
jgi:hypothetical protein